MYAAGKKALGDCDRCGFTYKLNNLQYEILDNIPVPATGLNP